MTKTGGSRKLKQHINDAFGVDERINKLVDGCNKQVDKFIDTLMQSGANVFDNHQMSETDYDHAPKYPDIIENLKPHKFVSTKSDDDWFTIEPRVIIKNIPGDQIEGNEMDIVSELTVRYIYFNLSGPGIKEKMGYPYSNSTMDIRKAANALLNYYGYTAEDKQFLRQMFSLAGYTLTDEHLDTLAGFSYRNSFGFSHGQYSNQANKVLLPVLNYHPSNLNENILIEGFPYLLYFKETSPALLDEVHNYISHTIQHELRHAFQFNIYDGNAKKFKEADDFIKDESELMTWLSTYSYAIAKRHTKMFKKLYFNNQLEIDARRQAAVNKANLLKKVKALSSKLFDEQYGLLRSLYNKILKYDGAVINWEDEYKQVDAFYNNAENDTFLDDLYSEIIYFHKYSSDLLLTDDDVREGVIREGNTYDECVEKSNGLYIKLLENIPAFTKLLNKIQKKQFALWKKRILQALYDALIVFTECKNSNSAAELLSKNIEELVLTTNNIKEQTSFCNSSATIKKFASFAARYAHMTDDEATAVKQDIERMFDEPNHIVKHICEINSKMLPLWIMAYNALLFATYNNKWMSRRVLSDKSATILAVINKVPKIKKYIESLLLFIASENSFSFEDDAEIIYKGVYENQYKTAEQIINKLVEFV